MEPAWTQFESAYKTRVDLSQLNVDDKQSPEMHKYGAILKKAGSYPLTVWLDRKGRQLDLKFGKMTEQQFEERTADALKKAS